MKHAGSRALAVAVIVVLSAALGAPAQAAPTIVLPRPGQVGLGVQGGYGTLIKSGELGETFGNGPALTVRLRYRMRYERAFGLSFEGQTFDIRAAEPFFPPGQMLLPGRTTLRTVLSGLELYQMFGTRTRTTRMVSIGGGLVQTSAKTADGDTVYPGDGAYLSVGAGVERFLMRSWALDLSTRYVALFLPDDRNHDVQVALGVMFYASY